jgi:hypothetical protein
VAQPLRGVLAFAVAVACWGAPAAIGAQDVPSPRAPVTAGEYEVKAAFLENFARFVSWPVTALPHAGTPIVIGIVGDDPFGAQLVDSMQSRPIEGHPVRVIHFRWNDALGGCHILFISASELNHLPQILDAVAGFPVLTVADFDAFARRGGAIELKTAGNRVHFEINAGAASAAGLHVSSKLLTLAVHVYAAGEVH